MRNRQLFDDLNEGEDRVLIFLEDTKKRGTFMGLVRMKIGLCVRWYVEIEIDGYDGPYLIETCEIKSIHRIRVNNELRN